MDKLLTIKVAASGVEKYIEQCLESFIDDRYMNEIEVIVINNKCEDNTLLIVEQYEKNYPNLFRVVRQGKKGYASTYNVGIELASGKYFTSLDGDDWYNKEALYKLINILKECDEDIILSEAMGVCERTNENRVMQYTNMQENVVYSINDLLNKDIFFSVHMCTIKTEILKTNNIKVNEACIIADVEYDTYIIPYVKSIRFMKSPLYYYRTGGVNQATGIIKEKERAISICKTVEDLIDWNNNLRVESSVKKYIEKKLGNYVNIATYKLLLRNVSLKSYADIYEFINRVSNINPNIADSTNWIVKILKNRVIGYVVYPILSTLYKLYCKNKKFNW